MITPMIVPFIHLHDFKVSETRLTVPSNQDVVLDGQSISVGVRSILRLPTGQMLPCKIPDL